MPGGQIIKKYYCPCISEPNYSYNKTQIQQTQTCSIWVFFFSRATQACNEGIILYVQFWFYFKKFQNKWHLCSDIIAGNLWNNYTNLNSFRDSEFNSRLIWMIAWKSYRMTYAHILSLYSVFISVPQEADLFLSESYPWVGPVCNGAYSSRWNGDWICGSNHQTGKRHTDYKAWKWLI